METGLFPLRYTDMLTGGEISGTVLQSTSGKLQVTLPQEYKHIVPIKSRITKIIRIPFHHCINKRQNKHALLVNRLPRLHYRRKLTKHHMVKIGAVKYQ
jgi:hypothetical protein